MTVWLRHRLLNPRNYIAVTDCDYYTPSSRPVISFNKHLTRTREQSTASNVNTLYTKCQMSTQRRQDYTAALSIFSDKANRIILNNNPFLMANLSQNIGNSADTRKRLQIYHLTRTRHSAALQQLALWRQFLPATTELTINCTSQFGA